MIKGAPVLILGLGGYAHGSGAAAAAYLARHGERVIATDLKSAKQLHQPTLRRLRRLGVQLVLGQHRRSDIQHAKLIVRNPGVPDTSPYIAYAKRLHKPMTNDVGLFLEALTQKFGDRRAVSVVAVTGTRGKSTTTALIGHILRAKFGRTHVHVGGNIGISPLHFIRQVKRGDIVVLEMSSWLLRDLDQSSFQVAVVTNLLRDHLNYYSTMAVYQRDKERIFLGQTLADFAVLNRLDARVRGMAKKTAAQIRWVAPRQVRGCALRGDHNAMNIGAAWEVARIFGMTQPAIQRAIRTFTPLPNRLEIVRQYRGRIFVNDTTATTPDATIAALRSFDQPIILIAGGNSKHLPLTRLHAAIRQRVHQLILLPGNATAQFPKGIMVQTMQQAVQQAWEISAPGNIILLSPGVTWLPVMNEFERGKQFVREVSFL